jgi:arginine-tRNA-protein transferase
MSQLNDFSSSRLQFYTTASYPCSYLPNKLARSQVATPSHLIDTYTYSELVQIGFRRSGAFTYRPYCDNCKACIPVRVVVNDFFPNHTQRRVWKRHQNLIATKHDLYYHPDHYALYLHYQMQRHCGGNMDHDSREQYQNFLLQSNINSKLVEFHENGQLRIISIIDELPDGISSVYTFFDPDSQGTSFGTHSILWQIQQCRTRGLPYLYLGYWIKASRKMEYKANFKPIQGLINRKWQLLEANETD